MFLSSSTSMAIQNTPFRLHAQKSTCSRSLYEVSTGRVGRSGVHLHQRCCRAKGNGPLQVFWGTFICESLLSIILTFDDCEASREGLQGIHTESPS